MHPVNTFYLFILKKGGKWNYQIQSVDKWWFHMTIERLTERYPRGNHGFRNDNYKKYYDIWLFSFSQMNFFLVKLVILYKKDSIFLKTIMLDVIDIII